MDIIMEKEANDSATKNVENQQLPQQVPKKKKKRGLLKMIKVFIFVLRRRSTTSKQTSLWKRVVTAMRLVQQDDQLHLDQHDQNPRLFRASLDYIRTANPINGPSKNNDVHVNMSQLEVPDSPTSPGCKSQYASAVNLQELDRAGNCGGGGASDIGGGREYDGCSIPESDMIEIYIDNEGDELIDARAEEFIANFYEQMKLQRLKSDLNNNRIYSIADKV